MSAVELELHQLELRYEDLRIRNADKERRVLASLADIGQQSPVVVLDLRTEPSRFVLLDGYKRIRSLRRLGQDVVQTTRWELCELDALVLEHVLRTGDDPSPFEDAWLLRELRGRLGVSEQEAALRFGRSKSWVSRRLGLIEVVPEAIQDLVRKGALGAHAVMKHLVPLARANPTDCLHLANAVAPLGITSRQLGALVRTYQSGEPKTRALVLEAPALALRAQEEARRASKGQGPADRLLGDLEMLGSVARRASARLRKDAQALLREERERLWRCAQASRNDVVALWRRLESEVAVDQTENTNSHSGAAPARS